jgi:hypothetical protein
MGVLTDLVVAPLTDAARVAIVPSNERPWPWKDAKGLGVEDLALMQCALDGRDPAELVVPPEWKVNPFTKERVAVTTVGRYLAAFEHVAAEDEVLVLRVPAPLVERLARCDARETADLVRRWTESKPIRPEAALEYMALIVGMAAEATARRHELFVWLSP